MKLVEMKVADFVDVMAADVPAPGGGSASALAGAMGAALAAMVCAFTVGKKKYAEFEAPLRAAQQRFDALKARFADVIDRDTESFDAVTAAFALPKDTDAQKAARRAALQEGYKGCTQTPIEMMRLAGEALELIGTLMGCTNASTASDLGCAVLNLRAALQGAWLNVCINVSGLDDQAFAAQYRAEGEAILAAALPLADRCYEEILDSIQAS